jgi:hypothetical protein
VRFGELLGAGSRPARGGVASARVASAEWDRVSAAGRRATAVYRAAGILTLNTLICWMCLEIGSGVVLKLAAEVASPAASGNDDIDIRAHAAYYRTQDWAGQYWREFQVTTKQRYQPFVLWRRAPFQGETINIDQHGIRRTPGAACGADSVKVFVLGGSTVWGTGAPDWGTIPAYLQDRLEQVHEKATCVVNLGETAFVSTQSLLMLLRQLQLGNVPHLVISLDGLNDVYSAYQSGRPDAHQNLNQVVRRFEGGEGGSRESLRAVLEATNLFRVTDALVRRLTVAPEETSTAPLLTYETLGVDRAALSAAIARTYLRNYEVVDALSRQYGFEYRFFWPPYISRGKKPLASDERLIEEHVDPPLKQLYLAVFDRIDRAAAHYSNLHSLAAVFDDYTGSVWLDDTHITPVGNGLVARKIVELLYGDGDSQSVRPD